MIIIYRAMTDSTYHPYYKKDIKTVRGLKRIFNQHLRSYEPDACILYGVFGGGGKGNHYYYNNKSEVTIFEEA